MFQFNSEKKKTHSWNVEAKSCCVKADTVWQFYKLVMKLLGESRSGWIQQHTYWLYIMLQSHIISEIERWRRHPLSAWLKRPMKYATWLFIFPCELFLSDPLVHLAAQVNCLLILAARMRCSLKRTWLQIQMLISSEAQEVEKRTRWL